MADQALAFLEKALANGYGRETAVTDPDLTALRALPAFPKLIPLKRT